MYSWLFALAVKQAAGRRPHSIRKYRQYEEADRTRTRYLTHRVLHWRQHVGRTASSLTAPSSPGWPPLPPTLPGRWVRVPLVNQSDRNCEQILSTWRGTQSLTNATGRHLIRMYGIFLYWTSRCAYYKTTSIYVHLYILITVRAQQYCWYI